MQLLHNQLLYHGQLDNLKIYSTALSSKEVLERYNWAQPTITSLTPSSAQTGNTVTIKGTGFGAIQGQNSILVNGQSATVSSWSDIEISIIAPNLSVGAYDLAVNVSGYNSNTQSLEIIVGASTVTSSESKVFPGLILLPETGADLD